MTAKEYIEKVKFPGQAGYDLISMAHAEVALRIARKEEREKSIMAFRKLYCTIGDKMICEFCSKPCKMNEFKKLLNE